MNSRLQEPVDPKKEFEIIFKLYKSTYIPDKDVVTFARFYYEVQLQTYQRLFDFWSKVKLEDLKPFISPENFEKLESPLNSEAFGVHRGRSFEEYKSRKGKKKRYNKNKNRHHYKKPQRYDPVYRGSYKKEYEPTANTDVLKVPIVPPTANTDVLKEHGEPTANTAPIKKKIIIRVKRESSVAKD